MYIIPITQKIPAGYRGRRARAGGISGAGSRQRRVPAPQAKAGGSRPGRRERRRSAAAKTGRTSASGIPSDTASDTGQISYLARISLGVLCSSERTGTVPQNRHTAYRITSSPPAIQSG